MKHRTAALALALAIGTAMAPLTGIAPAVAGPTVLYDFEADAQGWSGAANVASVSRAGSFLNGPGTPHGGTGVFQAIFSDAPANVARTVRVRPAKPLDFTNAVELYAWVDAYGGVPGATGYQATIRVRSGAQTLSQVVSITPDSWNRVAITVSGWAYRGLVTGIDIDYQALGTSYNWTAGPKMQLDDIGVTGDLGATHDWTVAAGGSIGGVYTGNSRSNATYRQAFQVSSAGTSVRLRFANFYSGTALTFNSASVGVRSGSGAATVAAPIPVTVNGSSSFSVPYTTVVYSDPVPLAVAAGDELLASTYSSGALPLLSHDWANRTQYATAASGGDHTSDTAATSFSAVSTQQYWIDAIDVYNADAHGAVVALGDSITDGAGTTLNTDTRWTDYLATRLNALSAGDPRRRTVLNAGIGGNTLSSVGNAQVGVNGLLRLDRDVLNQSGVSDVIVFAGTNDIYVGSNSQQVIYALQRAAQRLHDAGKRAIVATLIPRGNGVGWNATLETQRLAVNTWIRSQTVYDAVIDMEAAVKDPAHPDKILAAYDADGTHPNGLGSQAMANAIDLNIFSAPTPSQTSNLTVLNDFENGAQGWVAGTGTSSVSQVGSFANGPGIPMMGSGALDGLLGTGSAGNPKSVSVTFAQPKDLSQATDVYAWVDAYGGVPGATGYAVDITVRAGSQSITGTNASFGSDKWNRVAVDISGWAYKHAVTGITITYRISGTSYSWAGAHLQVDEVGYVTPVDTLTKVTVADFEASSTGWAAGANVSSVARVTSFANGPGTPHGGAYALQATMIDGDASLAKTISYTPTTALNLTGAVDFGLWFDAYGGVPGATGYEVDVKLWSGATSRAATLLGYVSDRWTRVSVPTTGWAGLGSVTKIDVTYRVTGTTFNWTGGAKFQVDDLHIRK